MSKKKKKKYFFQKGGIEGLLILGVVVIAILLGGFGFSNTNPSDLSFGHMLGQSPNVSQSASLQFDQLGIVTNTPTPTSPQNITQPVVSGPPQIGDTSPYGVTTVNADNQLLTDLRDLGIHWVRYQEVASDFSGGNFSKLDNAVSLLNGAGIHIDFAEHCLFGNCFSNPGIGSPTDYAKLATTLATRYDGKHGHGTIDAFEIGNEEFDFYSPDTYPDYLKAGCTAVKTANPNALCGMYGTFKPDINHYKSVVSAIVSKGDTQYMDFMNFHYYVHGDPPGSATPTFDSVWQSFHSLVPNTPIWVTEVGWPTAPVGCCHAVTPLQQSQNLQYIFDHSRSSGHIVQKVFWFTLDYGDQGDSLDRSSTGRLPAFFTFQNYVKQYPSW